MTRVSATDAKIHLGALLEKAADHGEEVVIENRGRARAVLLGYDEYLRLQELKERERSRQALARLEALAGRVSSRNRDLTRVEAEALAGRFVSEVVDEMTDDPSGQAGG
jgi:prevent-host-death family protein